MADSYTPNLGLLLMGYLDTNWDTNLNGVISQVDALSTVGALAVRPGQLPSTTLNVSVAPGAYHQANGTVGTYAGAATFAVPANATTALYLTASGVLTAASAYPSSPHVRLATVVSGASTITSIVDNRSPAPLVSPKAALVNAANDGAAATAGVGVGEYYRSGSSVQVRVV